MCVTQLSVSVYLVTQHLFLFALLRLVKGSCCKHGAGNHGMFMCVKMEVRDFESENGIG